MKIAGDRQFNRDPQDNAGKSGPGRSAIPHGSASPDKFSQERPDFFGGVRRGARRLAKRFEARSPPDIS
jgi:hypothetical protein